MSKESKLLKKVIKTNVGEKPTFGTNPLDPWSTKANISETALLNRYLKSRGINPEFASKDQKVAHSKTNQFKTWMNSHLNDPVVHEGASSSLRARLNELKYSNRKNHELAEAVDKKDTITFDIPLLIRVLEFAREDLKSDVLLHKMVERLIAIRGKGTLTMNQYGRIIKEEVESLDESSLQTLTAYMEAKEGNYGGDYQQSVLAVKAKAEKKPVDMKSLAARMQASYAKDEKKPVKEGIIDSVKKAWKKVSEFDDANPKYDGNTRRRQALSDKLKNKTVKEGNGYDDNRTGFAKKPREDDEGHAPTKFKAKSTLDRPHTVHIDGKPWKKFSSGHQANAAVNTLAAKGKKAVAIAHFKENTMDPLAATGAPNDCANNPDDVAPKDKGKKLIQMSKTAKLIKTVVKGKNIKEDMYDQEKEDKSTSPLGKKVKLQKPGQDAVTKEQPQAAAILTGGKTLTGEPRDTIEIDPLMKMRKQPTDSPVQDKSKKSV